MGLIESIFGTHSDHELKRINSTVEKVFSYEEAYSKLSDHELAGKTDEFKKRIEDGESLDSLLPEAFATVREAAWRVLGMKPYRVQVIGGIILHQGRIAEMKTGEGKTLVATMPVYLNALTGKGVHVVTVNDYLAKRDLTTPSSTRSTRSSSMRLEHLSSFQAAEQSLQTSTRRLITSLRH